MTSFIDLHIYFHLIFYYVMVDTHNRCYEIDLSYPFMAALFCFIGFRCVGFFGICSTHGWINTQERSLPSGLLARNLLSVREATLQEIWVEATNQMVRFRIRSWFTLNPSWQNTLKGIFFHVLECMNCLFSPGMKTFQEYDISTQ